MIIFKTLKTMKKTSLKISTLRIRQSLLIALIGSMGWQTATTAEAILSPPSPALVTSKQATNSFFSPSELTFELAAAVAVQPSTPQRPGNQSGGGARGDCPSTEMPLTVLMPASNFGLTTVAQPTLWFYVPYTAAEVAVGLFSLQTETGEDVGEPITISLPAASPGFVSLTLPESLALATLDTDYQWYFELYCGEDSSPVYVNGWMQRVAPTPDLEAQLAAGEMPADVAYASETIWFDAIAAIAPLRADSPDAADLLARWNTLLTAEGVSLGDLPTEPFAGAVVINESLE